MSDLFLKFSFAILTLAIMSCGGGSGEDQCNNSVACIQPDPETTIDARELLGTYDVNYKISSNTCSKAFPLKTLHEIYNVTSGSGYHAFPTIEVAGNNGISYQTFSTEGNTDGKIFFNVTEISEHNLPDFQVGMNCSESISLYFSMYYAGESESDLSKRASVIRTSKIDCQQSSAVEIIHDTCQVVYNGDGSFKAKP